MSIDQIVTSSLCMGCGLCQSLAEPGAIKIVMTPQGRTRPMAQPNLSDQALETINATCPGLQLHSADPALLADGAVIDPIWGAAAQLHIGYAADPDIRYRGSSGGVLTALSLYLLESKSVDFILHVKASQERPMLFTPCLSFDAASVLAASGSRYGPGVSLVNFIDVINLNRPFAVVGKPCDITAIRNLGEHDPRVKELVRYCLSFFCGGMSDLSKFVQVCDRFNVTEADLKSFRYRGYGNPGPTRLVTQDNRTFSISYQELWEDKMAWGTQPRCKICPDAIGEVADLVAGDCWPNSDPQGEDEGFNAIMVRTQKGQDLWEKAIAAGAITIAKDITFRDLDHFQPHQVRKKNGAWARYVGMRAAGLKTPRTEGLRLEELARTQDWKQLLQEARGARERAKDGRLGEPAGTHEHQRNKSQKSESYD
ncbi:MAG: coenzyme F420 hydrogenase [Moorea sp. SIO3I7]|nr:coenzyme F420 hydrogenase [Moorena sp. SIO3I7]NEO10141.1 coenzyme F420 hydrogenase [Moorena sp. SIO3I8]NEO18559.1 coenzyme F420 hydrogenase [Moorena sp. SIO4A5]NEP22406.1 coenzyme F420 hydrogenase [Moorena sp. SIO3I6]